jgi:sugar/nucleoside kinase (ribokinase family)
MSGRLVLVGSAIIDIVMYVDRVPERGGDVIATGSSQQVGGGRNVLVAAARQGMRTLYAGRVGIGPFGTRITNTLMSDGVELALRPVPDGDSGFCVALIEPDGERTFATSMGVEAHLSERDLTKLTVLADDVVYVSGYDLVYPHGPVIADWLARTPDARLVFDPSPLVDLIDSDVLGKVLRRTRWLSLNEREAEVLGDRAHAVAGVVVRAGRRGCTVLQDGRPQQVSGFEVDPVDTNGAGDAHLGAFVAALARGEDPVVAAGTANAAAAIAVTRRGPASCPTLRETKRWLRRRL